MHVTRISAAPEYQAPNHVDMTCLRLQGREAGPAEQLWLGLGGPNCVSEPTLLQDAERNVQLKKKRNTS